MIKHNIPQEPNAPGRTQKSPPAARPPGRRETMAPFTTGTLKPEELLLHIPERNAHMLTQAPSEFISNALLPMRGTWHS